MSKFIIDSPVFGAFRAWEPLCYDIAKKSLEYADSLEVERVVVGKDPKYGDYKAKVIGAGNLVEVYLDKDPDPFVFNVFEIEE